MPQQLPQVAILRTRHPHSGKAIFPQQLQQRLHLSPVGLLFAHPLGRDLGGIADPRLHLQLRQQPLQPARVPAGLDPHPHLHAGPLPLAIKPFGLARVVLQSLLATLSALLVEPRNLLHAQVIITSYNQHVRLLSPEPCRVDTPKSTQV